MSRLLVLARRVNDNADQATLERFSCNTRAVESIFSIAERPH